MDVNQLLKNTLSPDGPTRSAAEAQLTAAADGDFSGYLQTLGRELANESADRDVRMAAGLALKNSFSAREYTRLREIQARWLGQIDQSVKTTVKAQALKGLESPISGIGTQAAQFIAAIAAMEMPRNLWPELMPTLVQNVGEGQDHLKQASLNTIGFICEIRDPDLQTSLSAYSNSILTAVVQGARKEEANNNVRSAAITALGDSLEFVRSNFENEGERNYIMQVVCEATQAEDSAIQQGAYGCLNRIMGLYYDKMRFYMERALFGLTVQGMRSDDEDVAKLAIEFWCTVCEEELAIEDDNATAAAEGGNMRQFFNFVNIATQEVVPVLLTLLTKQDEDAADDDYNVPQAAYQCLQLWAQVVGNLIIALVLEFVEKNIRSEDWHLREAAVSSFGAIVEGPEETTLDNIVKQALPILIGMMQDPNVLVRDSVAFTLGRICEHATLAIDPDQHLRNLVGSLFTGLSSTPKIAASCCWALMNLAERMTFGELNAQENSMTPYFDESVQHLLVVTERNDQPANVRTAAYEVLNSYVANAAIASLPTVSALLDSLLQRLEASIAMRQQVVSMEDTMTLDEIQSSLCTVIMSIVQRLDTEVKPNADRVMHVMLQVLSTLGPKSTAADAVFAAVGALAGSLGEDFQKYMEIFAPFLFKALGNREEPGLVAMAIGLVSDITRALEVRVQPYCDNFMNLLLENLRSNSLGNQCKPAILQCFGDVAQAIGGGFEPYLNVVAQVLDQASSVNLDTSSFELLDYVVSLREGIMDAWAGIIIAMKAAKTPKQLEPYVESIFRLLQIVASDENSNEGLLRSSMGVIGDLADAFPGGEIASYYLHEWLQAFVKDISRGHPEFGPRTRETARWAREQVRRQVAGPAVQ